MDMPLHYVGKLIFYRSTVWLLPTDLDVSYWRTERKINHIHERALRIVYRDNSSSFIELLKKDNSVCLYLLQKHPIFSYLIVQSKTHYFKLSDIRYLSS